MNWNKIKKQIADSHEWALIKAFSLNIENESINSVCKIADRKFTNQIYASYKFENPIFKIWINRLYD